VEKYLLEPLKCWGESLSCDININIISCENKIILSANLPSLLYYNVLNDIIAKENFEQFRSRIVVRPKVLKIDAASSSRVVVYAYLVRGGGRACTYTICIYIYYYNTNNMRSVRTSSI